MRSESLSKHEGPKNPIRAPLLPCHRKAWMRRCNPTRYQKFRQPRFKTMHTSLHSFHLSTPGHDIWIWSIKPNSHRLIRLRWRHGAYCYWGNRCYCHRWRGAERFASLESRWEIRHGHEARQGASRRSNRLIDNWWRRAKRRQWHWDPFCLTMVVTSRNW